MRKLRREEDGCLLFPLYHCITILYKRIEDTARAICVGGDFVSRVTAYAMSTIAEISDHRLDLNYIWNAQISFFCLFYL